MPILHLYPKAPYDFEKITRRLKSVQQSIYRLENDSLYRTIRIEGKIYLVKVTSTGTVEKPELEVRISGKQDESMDLPLITRYLKDMLQTEIDLQKLYRHMEREPELSWLQKQLNGLRLILEPELFACMVKTIIGQQLNLAFAATLNQRLIEYASEPFHFNGQDYPVFPSPEQVARLNYDDLRSLQFSQRKAEYVIDFARSITEGELDLNQLQQMSNEGILDRLGKMRGIGRWTVECFLLFGLGRQDLLPAADIGLRNGIKKVYGLDYQPKEEEVREMGSDWTPWSSYITFYIWESLNKVPS